MDTLIHVIVLCSALSVGIAIGRWLQTYLTPGTTKLRRQIEDQQRKIKELSVELGINDWMGRNYKLLEEQVARYKAAAESHDLTCPETAPFRAHFAGDYQKVGSLIMNSVTWEVLDAEMTAKDLSRENQVAGFTCKVSGRREILASSVSAALGARSNARIWSVVIEGRRRVTEDPAKARIVTVIETVEKPVPVEVMPPLPPHIQDFLDQYPKQDQMKMLEAAVSFEEIVVPKS